MAMTINRMVTIGGLEFSLKVAGTMTGCDSITGVSIVGGEERSGAIGSVMISGSVGVGVLGINSQYGRLMLDCQEIRRFETKL